MGDKARFQYFDCVKGIAEAHSINIFYNLTFLFIMQSFKRYHKDSIRGGHK